MSKAMTQAIRGHNLRVTMAIAALAVLLLMLTLVAVLHTAPTTGDRDANPPAVVPSEHYGHDWNKVYGDDWNNYEHDLDQPKPASTGNGADSAGERHADVIAAHNK